jgi:hypothetical protein
MTLTHLGERICDVFSLNRTRGTADVWLERTRVRQIRVKDVRVPPSRTHHPGPAEIRAELERQARFKFGTWPDEKPVAPVVAEPVVAEPEVIEVGYQAGEWI